MRTPKFLVSVAALSVAAAFSSAAAAGTVKVNFIAPEHYTDGGGRVARETPTIADAQNAIRDQLAGLGQSKLSPSQVLKIDVLDLDLAGRPDVAAAGRDLRIFDDISPPRIKLRYALEDNGRVLLTAEETVSDPTYLNTVGRTIYAPMERERTMLSRWFEARFVEGKPPR